MENLSLSNFSPAEADLKLMVEKSKHIIINDYSDTAALEDVKANRIVLKKARVSIEKIGKDLRSDAIAFQKAVIAREKELIGIIEPEELRLKEIEESHQIYIEKQKRIELLPERKSLLSSIDGITEWANDEQLIEMKNEDFNLFYIKCVQQFNEAEKRKMEEERRKQEAEQQKKQAEAQAILEAEKRKMEEERMAFEKEKMMRELEEKKRKELEEKKRQDEENLKNKKIFNDFLSQHGYTEESKDDFFIQKTNTEYILFKKIASLPLQ